MKNYINIRYEIKSWIEEQWLVVRTASQENWQKEWKAYKKYHPTEETQVIQIIDSHSESVVF